jgi:hypothetical protein
MFFLLGAAGGAFSYNASKKANAAQFRVDFVDQARILRIDSMP